MEFIILFIITFIIIFSLYMIFFSIRNKKISKKTMEILYLEKKYKIYFNDVNENKLFKNIAFINSLIFTITLFVMNLIPNLLLKFILSFVLIFILVFVFYDFLATYYKRKKWSI